jgi:hypothetical protein
MALTQLELDTNIVNAQCCFVNKLSNLVDLLRSGDIHAECAMYETMVLFNNILALTDYLITDDCFTDAEICQILTQINKMCNDSCC